MKRGIGLIGLVAVVGATLALVWNGGRDPRPIERSDAVDDLAGELTQGKPPAELAASPARPRSDDSPARATPPAVRRPADSRIEGRILDADGKPVAQSTVRLAKAAPGDPSALTDGDGRFDLVVPLGSATDVIVSRPGFADATISLASLAAGGRVSFEKLWLIAGTVRERGTDVPINSVPVTANPVSSPESDHPFFGKWREDGTFAVAVPGPGTYVLDVGTKYFGPTAAGGDQFIPTRVDAVAAGTTDVRVTLERGRSIEGEIVDDAGQRVARLVSIDAVGRTSAGDPDYTTRKIVNSTDGTLRVPGLKPGRYDLWIQPEKKTEDASGSSVSMTVVRDIAAGTQGLVVRLTRGFVLVGRLHDETGAAVTGMGYIYAYPAGEMGKSHPAYGQPLGDGTFRVGPLDDGLRYDLLATGFAGHQQGKALGVAPRDADGCVIVLPAGRRISGRVETEDGKPVPSSVPIGVIAEGADMKLPGTRTFAYSAPDGTFVADGLADLPFTVEAGGGTSGYLGVIVRGVKAGTSDIVLKVSMGVELSGTLVDDKGEPIATTSLQADDGARYAAMRPYAQVGSDGKFRFRGLRAGKVRLVARLGEKSSSAGEVEAPGDDVVATVSSK